MPASWSSFSLDSQPSLWPSWDNLRPFLDSFLDILWSNTDRQSHHQDAHSSESTVTPAHRRYWTVLFLSKCLSFWHSASITWSGRWISSGKRYTGYREPTAHVHTVLSIHSDLPYVGKYIQAPFSEYLEKQKLKLHRNQNAPQPVSDIEREMECCVWWYNLSVPSEGKPAPEGL